MTQREEGEACIFHTVTKCQLERLKSTPLSMSASSTLLTAYQKKFTPLSSLPIRGRYLWQPIKGLSESHERLPFSSFPAKERELLMKTQSAAPTNSSRHLKEDRARPTEPRQVRHRAENYGKLSKRP